MSEQRRLRDIDSAERAFLLKIVFWSMAGGVIAGFGFWFGGINPLLGFVLGTALTAGTVMLLAGGATRLFALIHNPSGSSTPVVREYSQARAFQAAGEWQRAEEAWKRAIADHPDDVSPHLELARMYRRELGDPHRALDWYRRARKIDALSPGTDLQISREIIELCTHVLEEPRRAIPELARVTEKWGHLPEADWARTELARLRSELVIEED